MQFRLLAVGDVVGEAALDYLHRHLRPHARQLGVDFIVANGENISGVGLLPAQAEELLDAGVDVITLGNHSFARGQILSYLDEQPAILRPLNLAPALPGRGFGIYESSAGLRLGVLNLMGRLQLNPHLRSPFETADALLRAQGADCDLLFVDFHAETTSEKGALAYYLDGRVQALWGTHTHIPTADTRVLPDGCGFVSDLGMCGPRESVLGIEPRDSINLFLGGLPRPHKTARGKQRLDCVLFTIDTETKRCLSVERCDLSD